MSKVGIHASRKAVLRVLLVLVLGACSAATLIISSRIEPPHWARIPWITPPAPPAPALPD